MLDEGALVEGLVGAGVEVVVEVEEVLSENGPDGGSLVELEVDAGEVGEVVDEVELEAGEVEVLAAVDTDTGAEVD